MSEPDSGLFAGQLAALKGDMSVAEFARKCQLGDSLIRKYLDGAEPGLDKVRAIWRATNCSLSWLVNGEGGMYELVARENRASYVVGPPSDETVSIPHYDVIASAGLGIENGDPPPKKRNYFRRDWWHRHVGVPAEECFSLDLGGDSMSPRITPNHTPIVHRVVENEMLIDGVYVFRLDGAVFIKLLQRIPGRGLIARSENPSYTPWEIGDGKGYAEFKIIGRALKKQSIEDV